jgi:hypothetical protein
LVAVVVIRRHGDSLTVRDQRKMEEKQRSLSEIFVREREREA